MTEASEDPGEKKETMETATARGGERGPGPAIEPATDSTAGTAGNGTEAPVAEEALERSVWRRLVEEEGFPPTPTDLGIEIAPGLWTGSGVWHRQAQVKLYAAVARARKTIKEFYKTANMQFETRRGGEVDFDFADIGTILDAITPALSDHGLFTTFLPEGDQLRGWLVHEGGGALQCRMPFNAEQAVEEVAGQLSKLRRYMTCAMLNVAARETAETNAAAEGAEPKTRGAKRGAQNAGASAPGSGSQTSRGQQARPEPPAADNDWQRSEKPDAREIRAILAKLPAREAAALRKNHGQDTPRLLAECRKAKAKADAAANAPAPGAQAGASDRPRGTVSERIVNAFSALAMAGEEERALRTEYAGRDKELFEHLNRLYLTRQEKVQQS